MNPKYRPNLIQRCKRFTTVSASTQVLFCLGAMTRRWAQQIRYTLRRNLASIIKGLNLEYLTRNNQVRWQKNFQEGEMEKQNKKQQKTSNSTPRKPSFISCGGLGDANLAS